MYVIQMRIASITMPLQEAHKSVTKALFLVPSWNNLQENDTKKAVPDRLKPQECGLGSGPTKCPSHTFPRKTDLKSVHDSTVNMLTFSLPGKVEL